VYRASYSRRLVLGVAPCSTAAAAGWPVREFRAADTARKDVPAARAPRLAGEYRNRILNALAMPFPIHVIDGPHKLPDGSVRRDSHVHTAE
jgi:hypothetical protein